MQEWTRSLSFSRADRNRHGTLSKALDLFAREVMPEFKEHEAGRLARKSDELAPFVEEKPWRESSGCAN